MPAVFSIPRAYPARGCLIWEGAAGSTKAATESVWGPAARLGLAVFAIDLRDQGQRATSPTQLADVARSPNGVRTLVTASVKDLERAVEYLWTQPSCRHNVGYAGLGLGGIVGSILAALDPHIHVAILAAVPPSWRALIATRATAFLSGIADQPARLSAALRSLSPLDPDRWVGRISPRPVLLLFDRSDPAVPLAAARQTVAAAGEPKAVVYYDSASNSLLGGVAPGATNPVEIFLLKYLVEPSFPGPHPALPALP